MPRVRLSHAPLWAACILLAVPAGAVSKRHMATLKTGAEADEALRRMAADMKEDERVFQRLDALLAEYRSWAQPPRSADPAAALARRRAIDKEFWPLIEQTDTFCDNFKMYSEAVGLAVVSHTLDGAAHGAREFVPAYARLQSFQVRHTRLCEREDEVTAAIHKEEGRDIFLEQAAAAAERRRRALPWAAGGCLLAAVLAWRVGPRRGSPAMPAALPLSAPAMLVAGRFEVGQLLGHCGIGETYAAKDRVLQRDVALQRVRVELLADAAGLESFVSRGLAVAALKHPNLPRIHSVERSDGQVFVVSEPFDGETLEAALAQAGRMDWDAALQVARGCGFALEAAHRAGIVHGDVRPANVIVTASGEALLINFGAPPELKRSAVWATRPQAWGSPAYRAPELERNAPSPSSDVYALAVCVYQMLTEGVPFPGPDTQTQKFALAYPPPSQLVPGLRGRVDRVLASALQPEPARRFASAGDFVRALQEA